MILVHVPTKNWFPDAKNIRFEGVCGRCEQESNFSLQLPHIAEGDTAYNFERCAYYCELCRKISMGEREKYKYPDF